MTSSELRSEFLKFFKKNGHSKVASSSLLPADPSVLFTTAGMQQFKPYFLGEKSPYGSKVASSQKCFRTSDIEEVGDERHLTFFEMLGNFSFGGYGKKEAIKFAKEFLDLIDIKIDYVAVFGGDPSTSSGQVIPKDEESAAIWDKLGFSEEKGNLRLAGREDNFWGPTGAEGPCGPTTEIYVNGVEIWNLVFNEYYQDKNKNLTELSLKGVDTGMGLERLAMVSQNAKTVFETDLFAPLVSTISGDNERAKRIIADHIKAAVFLISEGILPSNVERGYVLRRILRRAIRYGNVSGLATHNLANLASAVIKIYKDIYPELKSQEADILAVIKNEEKKFGKTLEKGLKILNTDFPRLRDYIPGKSMESDNLIMEIDGVPGWTPDSLIGKWFFDIYQTFGFPFEMAVEELKNRGRNISESDINRLRKEFEEELRKHQEISRAGAESKFGGGGQFSPKLHTATHLMHAALREVLGKHIQQMGSDITAQRLRFDFSHPQKMTPEEIKKVEEIVNGKIKEDLGVEKKEMSYQEAIKSGALAFFKEKYPERVSVYSVTPSTGSGQVFSKEICAGPHAERTGELGHFKIIKEESSGAGVRRLRAILE